MTNDPSFRNLSFVSLILGGALIMTGGLMGALAGGMWTGMMYGMGYMSGAWPLGMVWWMAAWGFLTGSAVLLAAVNVRADRNAGAWGVVAIIAGSLSLLAMGGFLIGAVASVLGGALILIQPIRPPARTG